MAIKVLHLQYQLQAWPAVGEQPELNLCMSQEL